MFSQWEIGTGVRTLVRSYKLRTEVRTPKIKKALPLLSTGGLILASTNFERVSKNLTTKPRRHKNTKFFTL